MARLQKKKSPQAKKKKRVKKSGDDSAQVAAGSDKSVQAAGIRTNKVFNKKSAVKIGKPVFTAKAPVAGQKPGWVQKSLQFLREVKIELKKVTWPSRKQTIGSTVVVLVLVVLISFFLGLVDMGLTSFVRVVLQ